MIKPQFDFDTSDFDQIITNARDFVSTHISVHINGVLYFFLPEISVLDACRAIGFVVPRFCYQENLSVAGNCRMCFVEIQDIAKPVVACSTELLDGMVIYTNSPMALKARENILEFLLLNHPLDCPICDQAGECDLQDQTMFFGSNISRNYFSKRGVEDKNINHLIKTIMVRCIHCTKCVRFGEEICGKKFFGTLSRGTNTEIGNYLINLSTSEISANVIDLCPVGALTLKTVPFQIRPWEALLLESIDLSDSLGSNIYLSYRGTDLFRVVPKKNKLINDSWISNKGRFYFELLEPPHKYLNSLLSLPSIKVEQPFLFLLNPELDLKTLYRLKTLTRSFPNVSLKVLDSTARNTNITFWNKKLSISNLNRNSLYTFFLIASNLQVEMPLLNIRIKAHINQNSTAIVLNSNQESNFPASIVRFSVDDVLHLLKGTHFFFSKYFFCTDCVFFTSKSVYSRLDSNFLYYLLKKKIKHYTIPLFCNSSGANSLNIKSFNYKEFSLAKQIFGIGLDDTYLLRKFTPLFLQFYWINQFPSDILDCLPKCSWVKLDVSQLPGFYVNFEHRVQKFSILQNEYKVTMLNVIISITSLLKRKFCKKPATFGNYSFYNMFYSLADLKESGYRVGLFDSKKSFFKIFDLFQPHTQYFLYKLLPVKLAQEDPYRSSLQTKYSRTLSKSSQLLRMEGLFI